MMIICLFMSFVTAHASEFYYQPPAAASVLSAHAGYRSMKQSPKDDANNTDAKLSGLSRLGLRYDFGVTEDLSLYADLSYSDLAAKGEDRFDLSGLEPLELGARGKVVLPAANLLYGLDLRVGLERGKTLRNGDRNRVVGDTADGYNNSLVLSPLLGLATTAMDTHFGMIVAYDVYRRDSEITVYTGTDRGDVDTTLMRGNRSSLTGFVERRFDPVLLGADLSWIKQWELRSKEPRYVDTFEGFGLLHADVYARYDVTPSTAIVPKVSVNATWLSKPQQEFEDYRALVSVRHVL